MPLFSSLIRSGLIAALVLCPAGGVSAQKPSERQNQIAWYEALQRQLHLAPIAHSLGTLRLYRSDRLGGFIVIQLVVLPDNGTAQLIVLKDVSDGDSFKQTSHVSRILARPDFEQLKSSLLDSLIPRNDLVAPSPVAPGDIWVCADGPLIAIEVDLGQPTPLYLRRESNCEAQDPALIAANIFENFASSATSKLPAYISVKRCQSYRSGIIRPLRP